MAEPNQVWAADITYLPMARGFLYLVAIMDWHSRYVVAWRLSNTLEANFCVEALQGALGRGRPGIFNTDQGSQFTSREFTQVLQDHEVRISMDGKGRYADNIFVERLWRTVKYEEVYLKAYADAKEARRELGAYFRFYNYQRCLTSTTFAGGRRLFLPVHLLILTPLLGYPGAVAGDVEFQDDRMVDHGGQWPPPWPWGWRRCAPTGRRSGWR